MINKKIRTQTYYGEKMLPIPLQGENSGLLENIESADENHPTANL